MPFANTENIISACTHTHKVDIGFISKWIFPVLDADWSVIVLSFMIKAEIEYRLSLGQFHIWGCMFICSNTFSHILLIIIIILLYIFTTLLFKIIYIHSFFYMNVLFILIKCLFVFF